MRRVHSPRAVRFKGLLAAALTATAFGCVAHGVHEVGFEPDEAGVDAAPPPSLGETGAGPCQHLQCQQVSCDPGQSTTIRGVVYSPASPGDPLYNAVVYVPNDPVDAFPQGVACDQCGALASGHPVVTALSDAHGQFTLKNVPAGDDIPLVIQIGRWRRQLVIPHVAACAETVLPASMTHLPTNHLEGDIPHIAIATGAVDPLECVLHKIGIDDSEVTPPSGSGRVHYYVSNGAQMSPPAPSADQLWSSVDTLKQYDIVLLPCEGAPSYKPANVVQNLIDYTSAGGRVFTTHFGYVWIQGAPPPFSSTAVWTPQNGGLADPLPAMVNDGFPKGAALASWMMNFDEGASYGQIDISNPRHDALGAVPPAQAWITSTGATGDGTDDSLQQYTFNTPIGVDPAAQCGRVSYSDFHVDATAYTSATPFPAECAVRGLTAQERVIEFMLFDLASCIQKDSDVPTAPPTK